MERHMILEVAPLVVIKGKEREFEISFKKAQKIICSMRNRKQIHSFSELGNIRASHYWFQRIKRI